MRVLELTGVVAANEVEYDEWRAENIDGPTVGGRYVIAALHETFPETKLGGDRDAELTVLLAHGGDEEVYRGNAWACEGDPGYSSWTPGSGPDIWVGGIGTTGARRYRDLYERLIALDGQTVTLRIDDGPVPVSLSAD